MPPSPRWPNTRWQPGMRVFGRGVPPTGNHPNGGRFHLQSVMVSGTGTVEDPRICYAFDPADEPSLETPGQRKILERELRDVCRVTNMTCLVLRTNTHTRTVQTVRDNSGNNVRVHVSCPARYTVYLGHNFAHALLEGHIYTRMYHRPGFPGDYTVQIRDEDWNDRWNTENLEPIELWLTSGTRQRAATPPRTDNLDDFPALGAPGGSGAATTPTKSPTKRTTSAPKTPGRVTSAPKTPARVTSVAGVTLVPGFTTHTKPTPGKNRSPKKKSTPAALTPPTGTGRQAISGFPLLSPRPPIARAVSPIPEDRGFPILPPYADSEQPVQLQMPPRIMPPDNQALAFAGENAQARRARLARVRQEYQDRLTRNEAIYNSFKTQTRYWDNLSTNMRDYPNLFISVDLITRFVYHVQAGPEGQPRWFFYDQDMVLEYDPYTGYHRQEHPDGTVTWWCTYFVPSTARDDGGEGVWGFYVQSAPPSKFPTWDREMQQRINQNQNQRAQQGDTGDPMDTS